MVHKKILIADDEQDILTVLKRYLQLDGYEVVSYTNGKDVLENALEGDFDLFILDVMMPQLNGWEVCKIIKNNQKTKYTPVIILTAKTQDIDRIKSFESGADEYASKPFEYIELSKTIKELLEKNTVI